MQIASSTAFVPGLEAQMMEIEISEEEKEAVIHLIANTDADDGVIMVAGEFGEISVDGIDCRANIQQSGVRYFFTGALQKGRKITLRVFGAVGKRIRLTALFFKKLATLVWKNYSCDGCKFVVKAVVSLALHYAGVGFLSYAPILQAAVVPIGEYFGRVKDITDEAKDKVLELNQDKSELCLLLREVPLWNVIVKVFSEFNFVQNKIESLYEKSCGKLGCCP